MRSRTGYVVTLAALALSGATSLIAYSQGWATADYEVAGLRVPLLELTGRMLHPVAGSLGWVGLAGVVGVVASRGPARMLVGGLVLLGGVAAMAGAIAFVRDPVGDVAAATQVIAGSPVSPVVALSALPAWWVALASGALMAAAGAGVVVLGRSWPVMSARYDRDGGTRPAKDAWEALDRGEDPTQ